MLCLRLAHTQARVTDFKQRGKYENMGELQGPTAQTHDTQHMTHDTRKRAAGSAEVRLCPRPTLPFIKKERARWRQVGERGGDRERPPQPVHRPEEGRRKKGPKAVSRT